MSEERVAKLESTVEKLAHTVDKLQSELEIRRMQHAYGHYLDRCLYEEVVDMFTDNDPTVIFHGGIWKGKEGVRRLYIGRFQKSTGKNGPIHGFLLDHPQHQDIVHVNDDLMTAKARWRTTMQAGTHKSIISEGSNALRQWWEGGVYENEYCRDEPGGPWKIKKLDYHPLWHGTFEEGWAHTKPEFVPFPKEKDLYPAVEAGPDELCERQWIWPDTHVVPFHYPHPITGKWAKPEDLEAKKIML
ncbi:hypothetical protein BT69DRAFT_1256613 [Atractiella rhizophila]|nr:hypothetical protein BT69DRAFT_1256613 [Atractiella rhizophila]